MVVSMRRLDEVGRITIPRELIQRLGWNIKFDYKNKKFVFFVNGSVVPGLCQKDAATA